MQNSAVLSRATHLPNGKNVAPKVTESKRNETARGQHNKPPIKRIPIINRSASVVANNNNKTKLNNNTGSIPLDPTQPASPPLDCNIDSTTSGTSLVSRRTEADSEDAPPKTKTKFTRPRLNQLTEQRISRLRSSAADGANVGPENTPSEAPTPHTKKKYFNSSSQSSMCAQSQPDEIGPIPCPQPLEELQRRLEDLQSEFMNRVVNFREQGYGYAYKLVTIVHNDNCKVLVRNDDLLALPKNLPAHSVNDFKTLCHNALKEGYTFIFEQFASAPSDGKSMEPVCREELRNKLMGVLNNKLAAVDNELMHMCKAASKEDTSKLTHQICELSEVNTRLKSTNAKLDTDLADMRNSRDELQKVLESSQKRNNDLALELAEKNILLVEQAGAIDDLRGEIKHLKKTHTSGKVVLQQRIKENESRMDSFRLLNDKQLHRIEDLEEQLVQAQNECLLLKRKTDELMQALTGKETLIAEQTAQLLELEQYKMTSADDPDTEQITHLQAELERQQMLLSGQEEAEQVLRTELQQKQEELRKAELKLSRLEEQNEHNRQVLAVRGERINYLDQEMKQREQESNRRINEIMAQTSDKNTLITQISNELASTNEQFQNLCSTLSTKQTKLHNQEHVIKLLEESNARSVKLHTKLGEKNALLKDELDHLRRTVNNLMLGSDVNDADVADILLE
ncbi:putative leucine-rich repeat-containing protein DDB_G0290503 isoform X2 [Drosophila hydei]|uniref:Leucine-rich repeat-containing protein DDB_G0290503 isoform X2 n=1 Tax=Drosophila hydei TaxID=7224 RepID=A0A6J1LXE1_DROHY|nr:putative leucine-rich repeat-containing protein DDB_G0290503 isoform X2 [Drosophila hydei]